LPHRTHIDASRGARSLAAVERQLARNEAAVERIAARLRNSPPRFVATSARGSSDHAATFAKYVFETQLGCATMSASPSISSVYATPLKLEGALYLAISQSGKSPELVRQAQHARQSGAHVVASGARQLAAGRGRRRCRSAVRAGDQCRRHKGMFDAPFAIVHRLGVEERRRAHRPRRCPGGIARHLELDWSPLIDGLSDARNPFVGRDRPGAAQEAALKLRNLRPAAGFSAAEVRHGPMAIVGPDFPVLFLTQDDDTAAGMLELAREFRGRGARVWLAGTDPAVDGLPVSPTAHPACTPIVTIANFYRAANALALKRGRNPDMPPHLRKVIETV
jgi:glucosamine--fructose-6-phosphate aminotransferase (isomerizing)